MCALGLAAGLAGGLPAHAQAPAANPALALQPSAAPGQVATGPSGLPLPRFASLRHGETNLRTGPGRDFPIDWVYWRRGLPVEITAEMETWRRIRDPQGTEGWVLQQGLNGRRMLLVIGGVQLLLAAPRAEAPVIARAEPGVIGRIEHCRSDGWCQVELAEFEGWMPSSSFWGVYPGEVID